MQFLSLLPPILLSVIMRSTFLDFLLNKIFLNIPLAILTRKIPLSFESFSLDLFPLVIVAMIALRMNCGKCLSCLTWFIKESKDSFKF